MATSYSLQRVAQAWCEPTTSNRVMDPALAEAFANILDAERYPVPIDGHFWRKVYKAAATTYGHGPRTAANIANELIAEDVAHEWDEDTERSNHC